MPDPRLDEGRDVERAADRRRGNSTREMHQVADESPRPGQRKISSFRFVHPCTSSGTSQDQWSGRQSNCWVARPSACAPGLNRTGESKPTGNRSRGEGEAWRECWTTNSSAAL